ncbi:MAG TPA: hypothetical protein VKU62_04875 [Thermoanaerobaculia bacterium]|nr:hypothetical protein [Thermoanaerobaculia bacterium]
MRKLISTIAILFLALPLAAQTADSPLVAAAKAARKDKKPAAKGSIVITNDNLAKTGGHLTTTTNNNPLPPAPQPNTAMTQKQLQDEANRLAAEAVDKAKKAGDDQTAKKIQQLQRVASDLYGESVEQKSDDPAVQEHAMQQATTKQPQSSKDTSKPPQ